MRQLLYQSISIDKEEIKYHAWCWPIYIFLEISITCIITGNLSHSPHYLCYYLLNIALFYGHALFILPKINLKQITASINSIVLISLELLLYIFISASIAYFLASVSSQSSPMVYNLKYLATTTWRGIFFIMYATGYYFLNRNNQKHKQQAKQLLHIEKLKNQVLHIEKDYLRAQINPHLLFNTLNFIKSKTIRHPESAIEAIHVLSEIMDYAIGHNRDEFVPLNQELDQITHIIALNQLRNGQSLNIVLERDIDQDVYQIIPLVLLTFAENCFKHGDLKHPKYPALFSIKVKDGQLSFRSSNLPLRKTRLKQQSTGLANVLARLNIAYPNQFSFDYGMQGHQFITRLKINLNPK